MDALSVIDVGFDFREDTPPGKDPDSRSPTLRRYHKLLWSKPLPCGEVLNLDDAVRGHYLFHHSDKWGDISLSSDAVVASFRYVPMVQEEPEQLAEFMHIGYTVGGMMLWPGNRVGGKNGINGERGFNRRIRDRFDLTLECIRRHYLGERSPMEDCLTRYADFFALFGDFRGFVEHFLLQDAVTVDGDAVIFSAPFDDFTTPAIPQTMEAYREYRQRAITFIEARNRRILRLWSDDRPSVRQEDATPVSPAMALERLHASNLLTAKTVLQVAGQYGTRDELERAMRVAAEKGLGVRAFKTCLMFTPPSNATRCLFTIRAMPKGSDLQTYVCTEAFSEFFPVERGDVEKLLGPEGWRHLDKPGFEAFLQGVQAMSLR